MPEMLGAIEDACDVDERLRRIARQHAPREPPYAPPAPPPQRLRACTETALAAADDAQRCRRAECRRARPESAVSLWLAGKRPYPGQLPYALEQLPYALEQLAGADTAARIMGLIPSR